MQQQQQQLTRTQSQFVQSLRIKLEEAPIVNIKGKHGVGKTTCILSLKPTRIRDLSSLLTRLKHHRIFQRQKTSYFYLECFEKKIPIGEHCKELLHFLNLRKQKLILGKICANYQKEIDVLWLRPSYENDLKKLVKQAVSNSKYWTSYFQRCDGNIGRLLNVNPKSFNEKTLWLKRLFDGCRPTGLMTPKNTADAIELVTQNVPRRFLNIERAAQMYDTILDLDLQVGNELKRVFAETAILHCSFCYRKSFHRILNAINAEEYSVISNLIKTSENTYPVLAPFTIQLIHHRRKNRN